MANVSQQSWLCAGQSWLWGLPGLLPASETSPLKARGQGLCTTEMCLLLASGSLLQSSAVQSHPSGPAWQQPLGEDLLCHSLWDTMKKP